MKYLEAKAARGPSENKAAAPKAQKTPEATAAAETLAKENGLDLSDVKGTGAEGRITVEDVRAALAD
jgi:pyruvate/2-oxoglutarate dehydrogenase complex dihydrolipoamide acyltransferase (E2) component